MITIPQAGVQAGRSADLPTPQPNQTGDIISQVASRVSQKFGQVRAQQQEIATQRQVLDITREVGTERQRFDQITDPAQIEAEWPTVAQGLRDKYLSDPNMDPQQRAALDLTLTRLTDQHALALGERAITLTQSQRNAEWITARNDITTTAATADPDTLVAMIDIGEAAIDQRLAAGLIMPEDAAIEKAKLNEDIYNARAIRAISEDPAGFLAETDEYATALGAERMASLTVTAQNEVARLAAAEVKAAEAAATEQTRAIGEKLGNMYDLAGTPGITIADTDLLNDPAFQAHPDYPKTAAAVQLAAELPGLQQMTVAQLDAQIAAEEATPKTEGYQVERLTVLRERRDTVAKGWATDPVAQATASGLPIPAPDLVDTIADPAALSTAISQRMAYATTLAQGGYVRDPRSAVLSEAERTALRTATAPEADFAPKVDLAIAIARGTQGNPDFLTRLVGTDPVFAEATRLIVDTGSPEVATAMLRGQQRIATGTAEVPAKADQIAVFDAITGGVYDDDPASKARVLAAATALFADTAIGVDVSANNIGEVEELMTTAVQRVTGATPDRNGDLTVGGVQPVRDRMVRLPTGVAVADVDTALETLEFQLRGGVDFEAAGLQEPGFLGADPPEATALRADPMRGLRAASIDGRMPDFGSADPDVAGDFFASLQIEQVPGTRDQYRFVYPQDGRATIVGDANGLEYRFRLNDLIRGAGQ
jgi:hypothetical protein